MSGAPNSWINKDKTVAIWFDNLKKNWKIGPANELGTSKCWIYSGPNTSNIMLPSNIKNWYYLAGNDFIPTSDVMIQLKGKVIIYQKKRLILKIVYAFHEATFFRFFEPCSCQNFV